MGLDRLVEKISAKGFDGYALIFIRKLSNHVRFAVNKISITNTWDDATLHILLEKEKKVYITSLPYPLEESEDTILERALAALKNIPPREDYSPLPEPGNYPKHPEFDKNVVENPEKLNEIVEEVIDKTLSYGAKRVAGSLYANYIRGRLITSTGVDLEVEDTNVYIDVRAFIDKQATGHSSIAGRFIADIDVDYVSEKAAYFAKLSANAKKGEPGEYKTLLTPDAVASLFNTVGDSISAFSVDAGFSYFKDKLGQKVASEKLTIYDVPISKSGFIVRTFDDEGVPTKNKELIKDGVLKTYVHNRFTAKKFNAEHTGNAGWISPRVWELEIAPGELKEDELLEFLGEGLIVGNATYIRFQNYLAGTFSAIIRDGIFYVKNGEVKHAVRGLRLSDSMPRILQNIIGLSKERVQVYHWWLESDIPVIAPSIVVEGVKFTKAFG